MTKKRATQTKTGKPAAMNGAPANPPKRRSGGVRKTRLPQCDHAGLYTYTFCLCDYDDAVIGGAARVNARSAEEALALVQESLQRAKCRITDTDDEESVALVWLFFNHYAVTLEHLDAVTKVSCYYCQ